MNVGDRIRKARREKGLTQEDLGMLLGLQKSAIAKYENGRIVNIKHNTLIKIVEILGIPLNELICNAPEKEMENIQERVIQDIELLSVLKEYYKLSVENRKLVRSIILNLEKDR